ncbi:uncharacterized protein [Aquarana catesbeiana]|uniref:uncharacterized protein isoform X1 n=1 Tax=Aquarana catesbeiana TaxID=8400 RepID=UPI003CCA2169
MAVHLWGGLMFLCVCKVSGAADVPCGNIRHVSGVEGESVVLAVDYTNITDNSWSITSTNHQFATTIPGEPIDIRDYKYKGRLNTTANGSLIIDKLTREDQRTYTASILRHRSGVCSHFYNLTVYNKLIKSTPNKDNYYSISTGGILNNTTTAMSNTTGHQNSTLHSSSRSPLILAVVIPVSLVLVILLIAFSINSCQTQSSSRIFENQNEGSTEDNNCPVWKENNVYNYLDITQKGPTGHLTEQDTVSISLYSVVSVVNRSQPSQ